ncbi:MAG: acyl-CoA dehydrogenase family protein, partial [Nitrospirae bacterium]|nr:acyl-CoA dehydrogenase family protein [Nitrospirota bacterium]
MSTGGYESPWMNESLRHFRSSVREFIEKEFVPRQTRWRQQGFPDLEAWTLAGEAGILLPDFPKEYGGGGN